jgi:hypothetical protein
MGNKTYFEKRISEEFYPDGGIIINKINRTKSMSSYRIFFEMSAMDLFDGSISHSTFVDRISRAIDQELTNAWNEGADEAQVLPEDMTESDLLVLEGYKQNEYDYLDRLAGDIEDARGNGKGWEQFQSRIDLWINRYSETANRARVYFGGKQKYKWVIGATERHCPFCKRLEGLVAWADEWEQSGIRPQYPPNPFLTGEIDGEPGCGGWRCDCQLVSTTERRTIRVMDRLTEIALMHAGGI